MWLYHACGWKPENKLKSPMSGTFPPFSLLRRLQWSLIRLVWVASSRGPALDDKCTPLRPAFDGRWGSNSGLHVCRASPVLSCFYLEILNHLVLE